MIKKALETVSLVSKTILLTCLAAVALCGASYFIVPAVIGALAPSHGHPQLPLVLSHERLASHYLLVRESRRNVGVCTGTAIGPHAIMTATHCTESGDITHVAIDYTVEDHQVVRVVNDGRDHAILFISGSPLRNTVTVSEVAPVLDEVVTIYGVGGGAYPPVPKYGRTVSCEDPSDVDADAGVQCFSLPSIPGDSGSAIYNAKGEIVSIVTFGDRRVKPDGAIGFTLNFTADQLADAASYSGITAAPPTPKAPRFPFFTPFSTGLPCH